MAKECPDGYVPGRLPMNITVPKIGTRNKIWITNGIKTYYIEEDATIPDGFYKGRKLKINE